jgi:hypothetical protein
VHGGSGDSGKGGVGRAEGVGIAGAEAGRRDVLPRDRRRGGQAGMGQGGRRDGGRADEEAPSVRAWARGLVRGWCGEAGTRGGLVAAASAVSGRGAGWRGPPKRGGGKLCSRRGRACVHMRRRRCTQAIRPFAWSGVVRVFASMLDFAGSCRHSVMYALECRLLSRRYPIDTSSSFHHPKSLLPSARRWFLRPWSIAIDGHSASESYPVQSRGWLVRPAAVPLLASVHPPTLASVH